jgi:TniQ
MSRQLPVVLPPATDELLSSWCHRHANFYEVSPLALLRHCLVDVASLHAIDLRLTAEQASRIACVFRTNSTNVQGMALTNISPKCRALVSAKPIQFCADCASQQEKNGPAPSRRSHMLGWRVSCPQCGAAFMDSREHEPRSPFADLWTEALNGQRLIDDEAKRGVRSWASPTELARLLLMRRDPKTGRSTATHNLRLLGALVPEIDAVIADQWLSLPSPAKPILPLWLRPALLAGVSIVERQGPETLAWLQDRTIGQNRTRFTAIVSAMLAEPRETLSLLQHI